MNTKFFKFMNKKVFKLKYESEGGLLSKIIKNRKSSIFLSKNGRFNDS